VNRPPWVGDPSALVLLDWSWWTNRAFHGQQGLDGMLPCLVGWLVQLLAWEPAHLALCLDSPGETRRHRKRHPADPDWRYKANRPPKPDQFFVIADTATRIAELHGIPCLWADAYEADDVIATAVAKARAAGYRVWICSADKDLHHLVERDEHSGVTVAMWNPFGDRWETRGPEQVKAEFGVEPRQIADWLAIAGDGSDGVPGVGHGLGPTRAAAILAAYGTLAEALAAPVWSSTKVEEIEGAIKALAKEAAAASSQEVKAIKLDQRADLMQAKRVEGWRLTLVAHRVAAEFSRELTALDCDAPVDLPWEELPLGGYQVEELRAAYTRHGMTRKATEVPERSKRAPWAVPWSADNLRPEPRKGAKDDGSTQQDAPADRRRSGDGSGPAGLRARASAAERLPVVVDADAGEMAGQPAPAESPVPAGRGVDWLNSEPDPPREEAPEDLDERIVRAKIAKSTALGRKYIAEDLERGKKYRLRPGVAEQLLAELRQKGIAA
jgi:DNA polymerase-1